MRGVLEVYRWMWADIRRRRGGALPTRVVWFVDAVTADLIRAAGMTLVRAAREGGLAAGRFFRGPWLRVGMRGTVAIAGCTALFGPFMVLLGSLATDYEGPLQLRVVDVPGVVEVRGELLPVEALAELVAAERHRRIQVAVDWSATAGAVEDVQRVLSGARQRSTWHVVSEPPAPPTWSAR